MLARPRSSGVTRSRSSESTCRPSPTSTTMTQYLTTYDLVTGKKLADRYTIAGSRRQSGFAVAYQAADPDGEPCEVSLFPAGLFDQADQAEEFRARLVPWREVESPYVLRVREVLSLAGGLLLVTDLPDG